MKMKHIAFLLVVFILVGLGLSGCFEGKNDYSKQGVCILSEAAVWAEPSKKSKWLSGLALGETVKLEGKPVKNAEDANAEYIKIKLSDGTFGFVNTWSLIRGSYAGVIKEPAKVYKRPDLLAESGKTLEIMQIVAVEEEKDNWLRVTGESRAKNGWIDKDSITKAKEDVVTAALLRKALRGKEKSMNLTEMEKIVETLPYKDNPFVQAMLEKYQTTETTSQDNSPQEEPVPDSDQSEESSGETEGD